MQKNKPEEFVESIVNNEQNIRRIASDIKQKKFKDEAQKESWENNLERAKLRKKIIADLVAAKSSN